MLGPLCSCTVTALTGLSSVGPGSWCVATSLVACPDLLIAWELVPLGEGIGGETAAVLPGLRVGNPFDFVSSSLLWTTLHVGALINQPGWLEQM